MGQREFERELAKQLLDVLAVDGFALAGGQAAIAHGIVDRQSEDLDFFSNQMRDQVLPVAAKKAVDHLRAEGYLVDVDEDVSNDSFLRAIVHDQTGQETKIELAYDYREWPPVQMDIGPVIDLRDFAAAKMNAFCGRDKVRDTIDVFALVENGNFTEDQIVKLAQDFDAGFHLPLLAARLELEAQRPDIAFAEYGVNPARASQIRERMGAWEQRVRTGLTERPSLSWDVNGHPINPLAPSSPSHHQLNGNPELNGPTL